MLLPFADGTTKSRGQSFPLNESLLLLTIYIVPAIVFLLQSRTCTTMSRSTLAISLLPKHQPAHLFVAGKVVKRTLPLAPRTTSTDTCKTTLAVSILCIINHAQYSSSTVKPFACNICGHRCVTQQQLNNHLTTHSREKKFKCDFPGCGKVFGVKTALSTHKRTHTNEKPFACRWCGDSYSDSSNLSKHRKTVHEDDKTAIPCPHQGCEYRDSRAQRLERHCRDHGHGLALLGDAHKWSEYTRKKQVRSRTASVAPSIA